MNMSDDIISYSSDKQGIVSGTSMQEDQEPEILSLRPEYLSDYVGQAEVVETLKIAIEASIQRREPIDHVLLHGPPGLGKTTLAHIIANEMGGHLTVTSGPALDKGGDLRLANLRFKVKYVFSLLELGNVIEAYDSVEEAVRSF